MAVIVNYILIGALLVFLVVQELRYRSARKRIDETRKTLIGLSHQIRSPLTMLKKYNVFLREQQFGKASLAQMEIFNKMERATQEAVFVINRLLVAAKIEERGVLHATSVDLRTSIRSVVNALSEIIDEHKHNVRLQLGTKPVRLSVDPLVLHGIFDELLMNAINYTPPGGTITIALKPEWRQTTVTVSDNGIGIPQADRSHLFEQFFRGEKAKTMAPGNGLGLSFAQKFAHRIGGSIKYVQNGTRGSTFIVTLPKGQKA